MSQALKTAIAGCGNRGGVYSEYAYVNPDMMEITAVAEPNEYRRNKMGDRFEIPNERRFETVGEFLESGIRVDAVINTTMDADHYKTAKSILKAGLDMLIEKPICLTKQELLEIYSLSKESGARVMVCHVLRYAPFYRTIKELIINGEIGDIHSMVTEENVSYHHFSTAFVRGKWANSDVCGSQILMSKCCHDLDILTWLKSGTPPIRVSSFGGLFNYRVENAPAGSGTRCTADCSIAGSCEYDAKKLYLEKDIYDYYAREHLDDFIDSDRPGRLEKSLGENNPYGRCVWRCDNNVMDHQTVIVEFDDGCTASHNLIGGTAKPDRTIHIAGTRGEVVGSMEDGIIKIRKPDPDNDSLYDEKAIDIQEGGDGHGGGDLRLVEDFVRFMGNGRTSVSTTELGDSIYGHLIGFGAHESLTGRRAVEIERL